MRFCTQCGDQLTGARFCTRCGAGVPVPAAGEGLTDQPPPAPAPTATVSPLPTATWPGGAEGAPWRTPSSAFEETVIGSRVLHSPQPLPPPPPAPDGSGWGSEPEDPGPGSETRNTMLIVVVMLALVPVLAGAGAGAWLYMRTQTSTSAVTPSPTDTAVSPSGNPTSTRPELTTSGAQTTPAQPSPTRADSPQAALALTAAQAAARLQQMRTDDAASVAALTGDWVPQVSSKCQGLTVRLHADLAPGGALVPSVSSQQILGLHIVMRERYAAVTTTSTDLGVRSSSPPRCKGGTLWMLLVPTPFGTSYDALSWCSSSGFAPQECGARYVVGPGESGTVFKPGG